MNITETQRTQRSPYLKFFSGVFIFGTNGVVTHFISLSSYEIVFFRSLLGSIFLVAAFLWTGNRFTCFNKKRHFVYTAFSGLAMGTSWMFLHEAYKNVGVGISTLEYYLGPIIVMMLSPILFKEKLTSRKILGFVIVLAGMYLVNGTISFDNTSSWGLFCGLMSGIVLSIMLIFNKKATSITGFENSVIQTVFSFLAVSIFLLFKGGINIDISSKELIPILVLGIVNTGIGGFFYFSAIDFLPIQTVAICGYLEPMSAVIFSVLLLHEPMTLLQGLGAVLVIGGAVLCEFTNNKRIKGKENESRT